MNKYELKCPECGGKMYSYEQYYKFNKNKPIQICKRCSNKRQIHQVSGYDKPGMDAAQSRERARKSLEKRKTMKLRPGGIL